MGGAAADMDVRTPIRAAAEHPPCRSWVAPPRPRQPCGCWLARAEDSLAASNAPLALWPGAGTGQGRDALLRAHPLIDDGIIGNAVFGRHLMSGGVEGRRWRQLSRKPVRFAPALFLDVARA